MKIILSLLFLVSPFYSYSQNFDTEKLDQYFDLLEANDQSMGSIEIQHYGETVYSRSIGLSNIEKQISNSSNTKYRIGSISKSFTAAIALKLSNEGLLDLESPVSDYVQNVPNGDKITINHLIKHRSGLENFTNSPDYLTYMESPQSKEDMLKRIAELETHFEPGEKHEYCNTGYYLLSLVIEQVDGSEFSEILHKRVLSPLGLTNTYLGGEIGDLPDEARSYRKLTEWSDASETDLSIALGAGAIVSTPKDLNKFFISLISSSFLGHEMNDELFPSDGESYGAGIMTIPFNGEIGYGHGGTIDGFQSLAVYFPKNKLSMAYTCNGEYYTVNQLTLDIMQMLFNDDFLFPVFKDEIELTLEEMEVFVGDYTSSEIPLPIKVFVQEKTLMAQGEGQSPLALNCISDNVFEYKPAMITIEFNPENSTMVLVQGGRINYKRKE